MGIEKDAFKSFNKNAVHIITILAMYNTIATSLWVTFFLVEVSSNRWWTCVLSGENGDFRLYIRRVNTLIVSKTGRINIPTTIIVSPLLFSIKPPADVPSRMVITPYTASIYPITREPVSPINIFAVPKL